MPMCMYISYIYILYVYVHVYIYIYVYIRIYIYMCDICVLHSRYNIASGEKKVCVASCPQAPTFGGHDPCAGDQRSEGYWTSKQPGQRK